MNNNRTTYPSHISENTHEQREQSNDVLMAPSLTECFTHHKFSLAAYVKEIQKEKLKNLVSPEYMDMLFASQKQHSTPLPENPS